MGKRIRAVLVEKDERFNTFWQPLKNFLFPGMRSEAGSLLQSEPDILAAKSVSCFGCGYATLCSSASNCNF
uniref:hypothetical protein n=1 Tax=Candidatus Wunengus sp. YC64 TaxID=3367700 RepID=UPI00402814D4